MYRAYSYPFLQPMAHYTMFYNGGVLILLIMLYLHINLPGIFQPNRSPVYRDIFYLLVSLLIIGMIYSMRRIDLGFLGKDVSSKTNRLIASGIVLLISSYCIKFALSQENTLYRWLSTIHTLIFNNVIVLEIPVLIIMLIHGKKCQDPGRKKIINAFALFYILRYVILIISLVFTPLPRPSKHLIGMSIFIFFNIIPFLWIKYYFLEYANSMLKFIEDKTVLDRIYEKYDITKREQEIIKLILDGKSNKEIGKVLFISVHTVKNHVYNIFQKLKVKTRYELIHFITKFQKNQGVLVKDNTDD
jgi:DNA-binding CsgD family transcriptional regulator